MTWLICIWIYRILYMLFVHLKVYHICCCACRARVVARKETVEAGNSDGLLDSEVDWHWWLIISFYQLLSVFISYHHVSSCIIVYHHCPYYMNCPFKVVLFHHFQTPRKWSWTFFKRRLCCGKMMPDEHREGGRWEATAAQFEPWSRWHGDSGTGWVETNHMEPPRGQGVVG